MRRTGYYWQIISFLVFNFTDLELQSDTSGPASFINGLNNGKYATRSYSFMVFEERNDSTFVRLHDLKPKKKKKVFVHNCIALAVNICCEMHVDVRDMLTNNWPGPQNQQRPSRGQAEKKEKGDRGCFASAH